MHKHYVVVVRDDCTLRIYKENPAAVEGILSSNERNVPFDGKRTVPPVDVEQALIADCNDIVSSVIPLPTAPNENTLQIRSPESM